MKNKIFTLTLFCFIWTGALAQRTIQEIEIIHPLLEEIDVKELEDFESYQKKHFPNQRMKYSPLTINPQMGKYYRLKGTPDILVIQARVDSASVKNWDGAVGSMIESFSYSGHTPFVERIELPDATGIISFTEGYIAMNWHYVFYDNPSKRTKLFMRYISDATDEEKKENMRNILADLKVK